MAAALVAEACSSPLGPELPDSAMFAGLTLSASAEVVDDRSSVQVTVVVSNETSETQSAETSGSEAQVLVVLYRGSTTPVFDQADTFGGFALPAMEITLGPGESMVLPSRPVVDVREVLGADFEPGRYLVGARVGFHAFLEDANGTLVSQEFELRAGAVELR